MRERNRHRWQLDPRFGAVRFICSTCGQQWACSTFLFVYGGQEPLERGCTALPAPAVLGVGAGDLPRVE